MNDSELRGKLTGVINEAFESGTAMEIALGAFAWAFHLVAMEYDMAYMAYRKRMLRSKKAVRPKPNTENPKPKEPDAS